MFPDFPLRFSYLRPKLLLACLGVILAHSTSADSSLFPAFAFSAVRGSLTRPAHTLAFGTPVKRFLHRRLFKANLNIAMVIGETATSQPKDVVILGGGIIGASIAYHLTKRGLCPTVIERSKIAAAASGKSGGFLAGGWGDGSVTQQLHRVSFRMHEELAKELDIKSFRKIETLNVAGGNRGKSKPPVSWLDGHVSKSSLMDKWTAQVTPLELTEALMAAATARGAKLQIGKAEGVEFDSSSTDSNRRAKAVIVDGKPVPCDCVIVAMGPWSCLAEDWFGTPVPMEGVKSTSVVYKFSETASGQSPPPHVAEPAALFCAEDENGCHLEVYPRPNGEIYICGIGGSDYLNPQRIKALSPDDVAPDRARVAAARASFGGLSSLGQREPDITQACMRPCPPDALPLMGRLPGTANAYIAAGHNCWGILWAPVTGAAVAELVVDGRAACVDLAPFDPARFAAQAGRGKERGRHQNAQAVGEQW